MKRLLIPVILLALVLLHVQLRQRGDPGHPGDPVALVALPGEEAIDTGEAAAAVRRAHALVANFLTAVKEPYRPPLGDNIDIVRALSGGNRYGDVVLSADDPSINTRGEWVDAWGSPYHFHARAAGAIDVRSAGPDRILFTADDVTWP